MDTKLRNSLLVAGLLVSGATAGPVIAGASTSQPAGFIAEAGAPSVFVPIEAYRALDTRRTNLGPKFGDAGRNTDQVGVAFAIDKGDAAQIPAEAIAISYNVTVIQTEGTGFLVVETPDTSSTTSTLNWTSDGATIANSGNVLLGAVQPAGEGTQAFRFGQIRVDGEPGAKAHVLLDVTGYYLPADATAP